MKLVFGYLFAFACVFGGFVLTGGNLAPILVALPFEMMIIMGGAMGAFFVANQPRVLKGALIGIGRAMQTSKHTKARYMELLALLYDILQKARKEGLMAIEVDVERPDSSPLFQKYPTIAADARTIEFVTDYLRMMIMGNLNAHEIESLIDSEVESRHKEGMGVVSAYARLAAALPAFGIVAAVLGVIKTMASVGQPPEVLGLMIGAALLGTFLGVFLGYAVFEPLAATLEQKLDEDIKELQCIGTVLLASMQGYPPATSIEFGRKVLFSHERPSFGELEGFVREKKAAPLVREPV